MWIDSITQRGNIPVLEKTLAFVEARQHVLAENVAHLETPGYRSRRLDPALFQGALNQAIEERGSSAQPLDLQPSAQFHLDGAGRLMTTPVDEPADNILFHDRTNARIERLMTDLTDNVMVYNLASHLLAGYFDGLKTAIRGTI